MVRCCFVLGAVFYVQTVFCVRVCELVCDVVLRCVCGVWCVLMCGCLCCLHACCLCLLGDVVRGVFLVFWGGTHRVVYVVAWFDGDVLCDAVWFVSILLFVCYVCCCYVCVSFWCLAYCMMLCGVYVVCYRCACACLCALGYTHVVVCFVRDSLCDVECCVLCPTFSLGGGGRVSY